MESSKSILLLVVILLSAGTSLAQTHFHLDEPFKRPAKIPDALVPLLGDIAKGCRAERVNRGTSVKSWFSASKINVSDDRSSLILKSGKWCLNGVDNDWFWIFRKTARGYRLLMSAGSISLDVLKSTNRGLRDIETNAATAQTNYTNIYKFDGERYKVRICSETDIFPTGQKPKRVPCRTQ
jgi:hypothetical protein